MNKEQIKKMIADDFDNLIKERLDSAIIFKYINDIEKENQQLKEQLEEERKARKEAIEFINGTGEMAPYTKSIVMYEQEIEELLEILDIDKGE